MASRSAYTALTPEVTHFDDASGGSLSNYFPPPSRSLSPIVEPWWRQAIDRTAEVLRSNTGLILVALATGCGSTANVAVKKLDAIDPPVHTLELVLIRMVITWSCAVVYMKVTGVPDPIMGPKGVRLLLVLRGFTGFFGLFGAYYSLQYLSLSDATVLTFLSPICTGFVGCLVLKEKFTWKEALAGFCSLFGVILIARPPFIFGNVATQVTSHADGYMPTDPAENATAAQRLGAVSIALLGVVGSTIAFTSLRAIGKQAHTLHSLTAFSSQCVIVTTLGDLIQATEDRIMIFRVPLVMPTQWMWGAMLLVILISGFTGQVLTTMGLQRETASRAAMGQYFQIVFATIMERIFFHPAFSILSLIGTGIIMTSAIYVALTKTKEVARKGTASLLANGDDPALEEGLLEGRESEDTDGLNDSMNLSKTVGDKMQVHSHAATVGLGVLETRETPQKGALRLDTSLA